MEQERHEELLEAVKGQKPPVVNVTVPGARSRRIERNGNGDIRRIVEEV